MDEGSKHKDVDSSDVSSNAQSSKEKLPVILNPGSSGKGLPYAPEGWPCPGDVWTWRVGKRKTSAGYWQDRSLHPPSHLQSASGNRLGFYSKVSLEQYIRKEFPQSDVDAFFASFIWKIPATADYKPKDMVSGSSKSLENGYSKSESASKPGECKAGNMLCTIAAKARSYPLVARSCEICCSETGFCRDCCCILCCKTVDWTYEGYSFIRCEAIVDEKFICGHVAHMECALRAYMAGTVGGSIGLHAQYYCRRCDNKTDLLPHVSKLLKTCESLHCRDDVEKLLNLGICLLRGSEHEGAKNLQNRIALIMAKPKHGVALEDIWRDEENILAPTAGNIPLLGTMEKPILGSLEITNNMTSATSYENDVIDERPPGNLFITSDHRSVSVKLGEEIDVVLHELKRFQELEYQIAEQKLYAQKDLLLSLYEQLEAERSLLASPMQDDNNELLNNVLNRVNQIKQEEAKLKEMTKIAKGFGETPKSVLSQYFGLPILD